MSGKDAAPTATALVRELKKVVEEGPREIRHLDLPALASAAARVSETPDLETHIQIEELLRRAILDLDSGSYGDVALELFGLAQDSRLKSRVSRRNDAAKIIQLSGDRFRRGHEDLLLADVADRIRLLGAQAGLREARVKLEQRHPADSRLAVQWVERFEAYYSLWTPAYQLAAELTAYRSTLLEVDRPYDQFDASGRQTYSQEEQADGYVKYALFAWASFQWQLRNFTLRYGGMWLLSDTGAETTLSDYTYKVGWHVKPFNERDQSWVRNALRQSRGEEMDPFLGLLNSSAFGIEKLRQWREWCSTCICTWQLPLQAEVRFPTDENTATVSTDCQLHRVVAACDSYCSLVDSEWLRIADWYHLDSRYRVGVRPEDLYLDWRKHEND